MADKTTVLVIGSTGMLGTKIVNALLEKGETEVKAMVRPGSYNKHREDIAIALLFSKLKSKISLVAKKYTE